MGCSILLASSLLEKIRFICDALQTMLGDKPFEVIEVLKNVILTNVVITDSRGKVLRYAIVDDFNCKKIGGFLDKGWFPGDCGISLLLETGGDGKINHVQNNNSCIFRQSESCVFSNVFGTLVPILGKNKRLGTLILIRPSRSFGTEDLILAETVSTIVGIKICNLNTKKEGKKIRDKMMVQQALAALSYSELVAAERVFNELKTKEGLIVTSKIADRVNIARSVIVNALRKLKSAGVIETHSLGMKGTYLKVLNMNLLDQLKKDKY